MSFVTLPANIATRTRRVGTSRKWSSPAIACELIVVFACILLYIWRWQSTHPLIWVPILAFIILTHILHHDSPRALGLTLSEIRGSARIIFPLAAAIYVPIIIYALAAGRLSFLWPGKPAWDRFFGYAIWCCFQQYLMQSYFHRRLMSLVKTPYLSSAIVALMFGAAHIPNAVLIAATTLGGFILAEVYKRHPNIWPLALVQAIGGLLIAALVPAAVIHNMRVGPGYYTYRSPS